jgi:putative hemolysin
MDGILPQVLLVVALILINGLLAGSEIAFVSLNEGQVRSIERGGGSGQVVAHLARDPNRLFATIQIGITLAGFLASAAAAVSLAQPLIPYLGFLGGAAEAAAVVVVTLLVSYFTLVMGELAPKRLALQRAERWSLLAAPVLQLLATLTRPVVWLLGVSTDEVVRLLGADPARSREETDPQGLLEMVRGHRALRPVHRDVIEGAFEVAERTLRQVVVPRPRGALPGRLPTR